MSKTPPKPARSNKCALKQKREKSKRPCSRAAEFSIQLQCPFEPADCETCPLFGGTPKSQPETFVQLPTEPGKTDWNRMTEEQTRAAMTLIDWGNQFKTTENKAYAMKAIVAARDAGLYPPLWALDALSEVFSRFLKPTTKRDIGTLFGCGPGKNLVKELINRENRRSIRYRITQKYIEGWPLMGTKNGQDAVSMVEDEDNKDPGAYEHIAKEDLTPAERLNRAFYKSQRKKIKKGN